MPAPSDRADPGDALVGDDDGEVPAPDRVALAELDASTAANDRVAILAPLLRAFAAQRR